MITSLDVIDIQGQNIKFSEMSRHILKADSHELCFLQTTESDRCGVKN